jgi:hypothetical protein
MADTIGLITLVKVNATRGASFALFEIQDESTNPPTAEIFFVWYELVDTGTATGPQWMNRSLQVSLLRDALTAQKKVTVVHDDSSSFVNALQINA